LPQMKVGSAAYGGDVIDHGQMTVYDDAEVAGWVDDLDWWRQNRNSGTSAQLGYTVPFTLVHAGKYRTEDKLKIQTVHELKCKSEKSNNAKHRKTILAWFSQLWRHSARKQGRLILKHSWAHTTHGATHSRPISNELIATTVAVRH